MSDFFSDLMIEEEEKCGELPFVVFRLEKNFYALSSEFVMEMLAISSFNQAPGGPQWIAGVMNVRSRILELVCLRKLFGLQSHKEQKNELLSLLELREQDHRKWLMDLETSIREQTPFTGQTDPSQCAFGKWYHSFETRDMELRHILKRFDEPHTQVHQVAREIEALKAEKHYEEAMKLLEKTKEFELQFLIDLFAQVKEQIEKRNRQVGMVIRIQDRKTVFLVDEIIGVEEFSQDQLASDSECQDSKGHSEMVLKVTRSQKNKDRIVFVLDPQKIVKVIFN